MTVAISTLLPETRVELPGIPETILRAALYRVTRKFFWEAEAWKYTYDNGLDWTAATLAVPAPVAGTDIPAKCVVKRVDNIKYDSNAADWDEDVPFKTRDELDRENPNWRTETGSNPAYWTHDNNAAAAITPLNSGSTVTDGLLIRSIIAPVFTSTEDTLPDFLYYEFEQTIRAGILAELMKMPGKDWTDQKMASFYRGEYNQGVIEAKSRAEADYGQPKGQVAYGGL